METKDNGNGENMICRDGFTFFRSFRDAVKYLPKDVKAEVLDMIMDYGLDGTEPEGVKPMSLSIFTLIKPNIDSSNKKRENGSKRGSKTKANAEQNGSKTKANAEQNGSEEKEKEKEKENKEMEENTLPPTPDGARGEEIGFEIFGEFGNVQLKPVERRALVERYGEEQVNAAIADLSLKLADGSTQSINHYATLLYWLSYRKSASGSNSMRHDGETLQEAADRVKREVEEKLIEELNQSQEDGTETA